MTLNRRALTAIFPVVLLGYALSAAVTFESHKASLTGLEKARLSQQASELQSTFSAYAAFENGLFNVIRSSGALLLFMHETDGAYRSESLGVGLQDSVQSLAAGTVSFVSCAVFAPDGTLAYYFDTGDDPFAGLSARQRAFADRAFAGTATRLTDFDTDAGGQSLIMASGFVSRAVAAEPLPEQRHGAFLVQIAVRPARFDALRARLEAQYGARLEFSAGTLRPDADMSQAVRLGPGLWARLTPDPAYLRRPLRREASALAASALLMSLLSVGVLMLLVRRYITGPVSGLDRQVIEVMDGRRARITAVAGGGEVGRLSANVETLHDRVTASLQEVQGLYWTDTLTGISNRAHFNALSERMLEEALREGMCLTLLFIDLDHFKFVNDRFGHETGDALLKAVAQRIQATLEEVAPVPAEAGCACARLSGDEFAVLIRSADAGACVDTVVRGLLGLFKGGFYLATQLLPVTASIGIASAPRDATSVSQLTSCADAAMYQAKANGRNAAAAFSAALMEKERRRQLIEEEQATLDRDREFSLVYMPVVERSGQVAAVEALLRWVSPSLGPVSPAEFIPIAEATGQFLRIDDWVLDHAMADYARLAALFGAGMVLSINISSAQLHSQSIADRVAQIARKHAVPPASVELELTETFAAGFADETRRAVASLRSQGFRIAIDDFGVGYTSIQQIIEYPADTIKLDRTIVDSLATAPNLSRLRAIIAFCHSLGMTVTAEGIDTAPKARTLAAAGCDCFQGYGISLPLSLEALAEWRALPASEGVAALAGRTATPLPRAACLT